MNEKDKNQEHMPVTESNPSTPSEDKGDLLRPALHQPSEPQHTPSLGEETGMDKPRDFSPVPPPREESYSAMPPPVTAEQMASAEEPKAPATEKKPETIVIEEEYRRPQEESPRTPPYPSTTSPQASQEPPYWQGDTSSAGGQPPRYQEWEMDWTQPYQPPRPQPERQSSSDEYVWDYAAYETYQDPKKKKNRGVAAFIGMLALTLVIGVGGLFVAGLMSGRGSSTVPPSAVTAPEGEITGEMPTGEGEGVELPFHITETPDRSAENLPAAGEILTVPQVAQKVIPSVVGVMKYSEGNLYEPTGLGSGIILSVSEEGDAYIISNAHVVEYGTNFMVRVSDGQEFDASLVGEDVRSDLAVLKITAEELGEYQPTPAELGTSEQTQVGETVVAIGNPVNFDLSGSVTQGIVSAINRQIQTTTTTMNYIQTDAAINPGNSGGALANTYGQVIGINTMKVNAIGFEGIGFAIPISDALPILQELVSHGAVTSRAMLGITAYAVPESQDGTHLIPAGIKVQEVSANAKFTPPIKEHDIITHCNGERVYQSGDLHVITNAMKAGDTLTLTVFRKTSTVAYDTIDIIVELISSADYGEE